ncbi:MAG: hypothetical protein HY644_10415 [Acidobacteria bacterium]|nr:hypothetical protein [Acidobacteriota bacterium]
MIGYTQKDQKGEQTTDNWLIRSWKDKALQPGKTSHIFEVRLPDGVDKIKVQATLTYRVGDVVKPMTQVSRSFLVPQLRKEKKAARRN